MVTITSIMGISMMMITRLSDSNCLSFSLAMITMSIHHNENVHGNILAQPQPLSFHDIHDSHIHHIHDGYGSILAQQQQQLQPQPLSFHDIHDSHIHHIHDGHGSILAQQQQQLQPQPLSFHDIHDS